MLGHTSFSSLLFKRTSREKGLLPRFRDAPQCHGPQTHLFRLFRVSHLNGLHAFHTLGFLQNRRLGLLRRCCRHQRHGLMDLIICLNFIFIIAAFFGLRVWDSPVVREDLVEGDQVQNLSCR